MENKTEHKHLTIETATKFFAEFYRGEHHIPSKIKEFGYGFCVNHDRGDMATHDYNNLTRIVLMAHRDCIRVGITAVRNNILQIAIWQRQGREGSMSERHPTIETAISIFNQ